MFLASRIEQRLQSDSVTGMSLRERSGRPWAELTGWNPQSISELAVAFCSISTSNLKFTEAGAYAFQGGFALGSS